MKCGRRLVIMISAWRRSRKLRSMKRDNIARVRAAVIHLVNASTDLLPMKQVRGAKRQNCKSANYRRVKAGLHRRNARFLDSYHLCESE